MGDDQQGWLDADHPLSETEKERRDKGLAADAIARFGTMERLGGGLGERDRVLIQALLSLPRAAAEMFVRLQIARAFTVHRVDFAGPGHVFDIGDTQLESLRTEAAAGGPLVPCSGLWKPGQGMLEVLRGLDVADEPPDIDTALARFQRMVMVADVEVANGPWEGNRATRYTLHDVSPETWDSDRSGFCFAAEAFLHAIRDRRSNSLDVVVPGLPESDQEPQLLNVQDDFVDAAQPLVRFKRRHIRELAASEVEELQLILRRAQRRPPADLDEFVRVYNQLLDTFNLRLSIDGEVLGRLRVTTAREGYRYIQFSVPLTRGGGRGGGRGGFSTADIKLVRVPDNYVGKGPTPHP